MTGGVAVILGPTGKNFAAGMSGGVAYVLDENNKLYKNLNKQLVSMENVDSKVDKEELKAIISEHVKVTGSKKGKGVLDDFDNEVKHFKKIIPTDYKIIMKEIAHQKEQGADDDTAKIEAFKVVVGGEK
jgi:glutamate synthase (ferredoxin)